MPSGITETVSLYYEDNFATTPEMGMIWPTVEQYHEDSYALAVLATYLGDGKRAPFNEVMIDEEKVTSSISIFKKLLRNRGRVLYYYRCQRGRRFRRAHGRR